jgi:peptidoglycan/LPS O-acetylase OafA/YrhL
MATTDNSPQRIYFKNLDILRFMAAYMVVILHSYFGWKSHFGGTKAFEDFSERTQRTIDRVMENFTIGVDIFFLISGFLLTYLLLVERQKNGKVDVMKFYIRRAFRIWPLYFVLLLIGPLMTYFFGEQAPGYAYHFFFLGNFDLMANGTKSIATDHLWSICIEEHYYIICPLIIGFIAIKRLPEVLLFIAACCLAFRGYISLTHEDVGNIIYVHTFSRMDVLALGSLFGYLFYHKKLVFNHPLSIRLMVYATFIFVFLNVGYGEAHTFFYATIKKYFFVLTAAYWMGNFLFHPNSILSVEKPNIFHTFGKITYGLYMFNPIVIYLVLQAYSKYNFSNYPLFIISVHAILAVICFLSYRFFEMPFLALKEKYAVVKSGGVISTGETAPVLAEAVVVSAVSPVTESTHQMAQTDAVQNN